MMGGPDPNDLPLLSVSALNRMVGQALTRQFPMVRLEAELGQVTQAASGHWYLSLKDGQASVKAVLFRREAAALRFRPTEGMKVEVRAAVGLYEARGDFQLQILQMMPAGQGSLFELFLQLKAKLAAEGLFDPTRKRPLPSQIRRIGLVTSASGAALRDFLITLRQSAPRIRVTLLPSLVQGADAPAALCEAIDRAASLGLDALALVRGGGSLEDLWAFNDERLVRQLAACPVYVVTGVGHETDTTLVDWVADERAATPTAAAHWLAQQEERLWARRAEAEQVLRRTMGRRLEQAWLRLDRAQRALPNPRGRLESQRQAWLEASSRLARLGGRQGPLVRPLAQRLEAAGRRLEALNPLAVLARGYVLATDLSGLPCTSSRELSAGDRLTLVWADGEVSARVE